eukprot:155389_1
MQLLLFYLYIRSLLQQVNAVDFTLVAEFKGLADVNGTTESVEYDADNNVYYIVNRGMLGEIGTISTEYPIDSSNAMFTEDIGDGTIIGDIGATGMVYYDGYLYVGSYNDGSLRVYNIKTKTIDNTITGFGVGANGLCQDPDNDNMLYLTNAGLDLAAMVPLDEDAGLWSIDITDWTVTRLYTGSESNLENDYVFHPNGCSVKNGIIYMVETRIDLNTGSLGKYTISDGSFVYDEILSVSADGILINDHYIFVTALGKDWASLTEGGSLLYYEIKGKDGFQTAIGGLSIPADITFGPHDMIVIPELEVGTIAFVQFTLQSTSFISTLGDNTNGLQQCICSVAIFISIFHILLK